MDSINIRETPTLREANTAITPTVTFRLGQVISFQHFWVLNVDQICLDQFTLVYECVCVKHVRGEGTVHELWSPGSKIEIRNIEYSTNIYCNTYEKPLILLQGTTKQFKTILITKVKRERSEK